MAPASEETLNSPIWVGVGAVALGGFLLLAPRTS
jgi:hypothetical protein